MENMEPIMAVRVDPAEMVRYVQALMSHERYLGGDRIVAHAAQVRWDALNRALGDARVSPWTLGQRRDQIHVPAALVAAAGVATLKLAADEVVFDIPTLLDATLQLCEPVGHA
jgi:hypothetical protein